ncbi:glycosyltransferase family 2 protein [Labrys sp. 22185]|uniref:glycosyltransferase family 2 protein n=1 Tax=Labrys sp. 22185 TaxID=3453888 RepID=UPI003F84C97E
MPDISFLIACFNAERTVEAAIVSALAQHNVTVEVIVVDDVSEDGTLARATALAREEPRVRILAQEINAGPAAARNRALAAARGEWVAILDADDYVAPGRSEHLIGLASEHASQVVADNLMRFRDDTPEVAWPLLPHRYGYEPFAVGLVDYLDRNRMTDGDAALGYLKPMFQRAFLQSNGITYDEGLRIGEDFNFVLQALCAGARFTITPQAFYYYRMVAGSLSRRLAPSDLEQLLDANDRLLAERPDEPGLHEAVQAYRRSAEDLATYSRFRSAVRQGAWGAILQGMAEPRLWGTMTQMLVHARRRSHVQQLAIRRAAGRYRPAAKA